MSAMLPPLKFPYILCYGSTGDHQYDASSIHKVSIHPMLRFNAPAFNCFMEKAEVSIHPMLRFNWNRCDEKLTRIEKFPYILWYGSTSNLTSRELEKMAFPYILCYGSTFPG